MTELDYYLVLWWCLCSDVSTNPAALPERCPHHDRAASVGPFDLAQDGPVEQGHRCTDESVLTPEGIYT